MISEHRKLKNWNHAFFIALLKMWYFKPRNGDRWKITPTNLCTFCGLEPETILHLFFECPAATDIWNKLTFWIKNKTNRNIKSFTKKNVIFCTAGQKAKDYVNTLCLRILASYAAKIAKICNFWTFWPVISWITGQNVQKLQIFAIFAA